MPINSKQKGARGEREFASLCKEHGFDVRRTQQYCGNVDWSKVKVDTPVLVRDFEGAKWEKRYFAFF